MGPVAEQSINRSWVARFDRTCPSGAASLRLFPGAEACLVDGALWVRGYELSEEQQHLIHSASPIELFEIRNSKLASFGCEIPVREMPSGDWKPVADVLVPAVPSALEPAPCTQRVRLGLRRDVTMRVATLLKLPIHEWLDWAETAPGIRLSRLTFAASTSEAIVMGTPLPPIPGKPYWIEQGIAMPCGYCLDPAIDAKLAAAVLGLQDEEVALFEPDGCWQRLQATDFVVAVRSAVRATRTRLTS